MSEHSIPFIAIGSMKLIAIGMRIQVQMTARCRDDSADR
jgi:hypothetical protein